MSIFNGKESARHKARMAEKDKAREDKEAFKLAKIQEKQDGKDHRADDRAATKQDAYNHGIDPNASTMAMISSVAKTAGGVLGGNLLGGGSSLGSMAPQTLGGMGYPGATGSPLSGLGNLSPTTILIALAALVALIFLTKK